MREIGLHPVRALGFNADEMALLKPLALLTAKPAIYVANVGEHGFEGNPLLERVKAYAAKEGAPVVAISAKLESEIADLADDEKEIFLADMGMTEPGLTGPWQVMGRNAIPFQEMVKLDYLYVTDWSLWSDIKLLLRTLPVVVGRRGA